LFVAELCTWQRTDGVYNGGMQIKAFIKYSQTVFCRAIRSAWAFYGFISGVLVLVAGIIVWKHPDWGATMNNLLWMIPLGAFLLMMAIGFFVTPYKIDKERKKEIEKLQDEINYLKKQGKTFFEDNIDAIVKSLENDIREIDKWFEYVKKQTICPCRELSEILHHKMDFLTTKNAVGNILLFLKDYRPMMGNSIKTEGEEILQQWGIAASKCGDDTKPPLVEMVKLKKIMQDFINLLLVAKQITKEEKGNKL
jgi:hypothetical protein